ncbi:hypothetical protein V1504DRAFT_471480 [Lipomyces starkeyi]
MSLENFLNPAEESKDEDPVPEVSDEELLEQIIASHTGQTQESADTEDEEDPPMAAPNPSLPEALQFVKGLIRYSEGQDDVDLNIFRCLEKYERQLEMKRTTTYAQSKLDKLS